MQILLPMAGNGSRFAEAGYDLPKPLIDVAGMPMIERVIENLGYDHTYTFVVRREHYEPHAEKFHSIFRKTGSQFAIFFLDETTDGAARTCLKAMHLIDLRKPLIIANCDQIMDWNKNQFYADFGNAVDSDIDGMILTFNSTNPAHSYVKMDENHTRIAEVAEKVVISDIATIGVYAWSQALLFKMSAEAMIEKNIRTNNEFYVAPTFNEAIVDGAEIIPYYIGQHHPIGTPEQLKSYLEVLAYRNTLVSDDFAHWN